MKKVLSTTLSIVMMSTNANSLSNSKDELTDISGHWAERDIDKMFKLNVVDGYLDNTFKPDNLISRAEFIKVVNKYFRLKSTSNINFKDVTNDSWFYKEIQISVGNGYIDGYPDNTFRPYEPITRQEAIKIVCNLAKIYDTNINTVSSFLDSSKVSDWAKFYVEGAIESGVIFGYENNTIRPDINMTRAEAIAMLSRLNKIINDSSNTQKPSDDTNCGTNHDTILGSTNDSDNPNYDNNDYNKPNFNDPTPVSNINIDTNGDGIPDLNIDIDGDGIADLNIDTTGDYKPNINIDTDGDKKPDINIDIFGNYNPYLNIDIDGDGIPDLNIDTNGDNKPDINIDTNGDGNPNINIDNNGDKNPNINIDTNGDGIPDLNIDIDGDGIADLNIDTTGDYKPNINIDTDGDNKPDINIDTNGDKKPDINIDTNNDGKPDIDIDLDDDRIPDLNIDNNDDLIPDINIDTNGDKKPDINIDTNGDGIPDLNVDTNNDGTPDINIDTTGDGKPNINIDTNGDNKPDINVDTDGDKKPDFNIDNNNDNKPDINIDINDDGVYDSIDIDATTNSTITDGAPNSLDAFRMNSGFEEGKLNPVWSTHGYKVTAFGPLTSTKFTGKWCAQILCDKGENKEAGIYSKLGKCLKPNTTYTLKVRARLHSGSAYLYVKNYDENKKQDKINFDVDGSTIYPYELTFTTGYSYSDVEIGIWKNKESTEEETKVFFDDFEIIEHTN